MKRILLFLVFVVFFRIGNAQTIKIQFKTFAIDIHKSDSLNLSYKSYIVLDTVAYLIKDNRKAVRINKLYLEGDTNLFQRLDFSVIIDKRKDAVRYCSLDLQQNEENIVLELKPYSSWKKISKELNLRRKDTPLRIEYTKETKQIGDYLCKKVIVEDNGDIIEVWYTESMYYNWMLVSYFSQIPGTVISAKTKDGEEVLSFISLQKMKDKRLILNNWK